MFWLLLVGCSSDTGELPDGETSAETTRPLRPGPEAMLSRERWEMSCDAPVLDQTLLADGGFEDALGTAWTLREGACEWVSDPTGPQAELSLYGGDEGSCEAVQTVVLTQHGICPSLVDEGGLSLELSGYLRTADSPTPDNGDLSPWDTIIFDDHAWFEARMLDGAGQLLQVLRSPIGDHNEWIHHTLTHGLPAGTRSVEVAARADHRRGAANDGGVDGLGLLIQEAADPATILTKQPVLYAGEPGELTVLWETDTPAGPHELWLGTDALALWPGVIETVQLAVGRHVHRARLSGLPPATEHTYQVRSSDAVSAEYGFRTLPDAGPLRVVITGDNQIGSGTFTEVVDRVADHQPDLFFSVGDIVQNGQTAADWDSQWFAPLETDAFSQTTPTLFARGNHDHEWQEAYAYTELPGNGAWFATVVGPVFLVVLDSQWDTTHDATLSDQQAFLDQALASADAQDAAFRVVSFHIPAHTNVWKTPDWDGEPAIRDDWVPRFVAGGVDLVIAGHSHAYQRGELDGVMYVVTGGAGGTLDTNDYRHWDHLETGESVHHYVVMDVDEGGLSWTAWDLAGGVVDTFELEAR